MKPEYKVQHPYDYNFVRMNQPGSRRSESLAKRIRFYMASHNMTHEQFVDRCAMYANQYGTNFTIYDLHHYLYQDISPKIDKLTAIAKVMHEEEKYFCGYGPRKYPFKRKKAS